MPNDGVDERDDRTAVAPEDVRDTLCLGSANDEQDEATESRDSIRLRDAIE